MKKFIGYIILVTMIVSTAFSQPKLEVAGGDTYDWREVYPSENPLKAKIILKNTGDQKLIIRNVQPGCSCTTAPLEKDELEPGESIYMDVTMEIKKTDAVMNKYIKINTNETENPFTMIYLKAHVIRPIEVLPRSVFFFKNLVVNQPGTDTLTLKNVTKKPITISDFEIKPETAKLSLTEAQTLEPGEEINIILTVTAEKEGMFNGSVKMKTSKPEMPDLSIFCSGRVKKAEKE